MANLSNINNKFLVTTGGNVGINSTGPVLKLDVQGTASTPTPFGSAAVNGVVRIGSSSSNPILDIGSNSAAPYEMWLQAHVPANTYGTPISLQPLGGNVGIGTTSPSTKLTISGAQELLQLTRGGASDTKWFFSADSERLFIAENTSATANIKITIREEGNVGIGTVTPVSTWASTFDPSTGNGNFKLTSEGWIVTPYLTGLAEYYPGQGARPIIWADTTGTNIQSWDNNSTDGVSIRSSNKSIRLFVREDGNVGIGTSAPIGKLTVQSDNADIFLRSANYTIARVISRGSSGSNLNTGLFSLFYSNSADQNNIERVRLDAGGNSFFNGGNVGIGTTTPNDKLNIHDSSASANLGLKITRGSQTHGLRLGVNDSHAFLWTTEAEDLVFATNDSQRITIEAAGNVGIGTTNPIEKFQVRTNTTTDNSFQGINVENFGTTATRAGISFKCYDWVQSAIWHGRGALAAYNGALVLGTNPNTSDLTVGGVTGRMWILNNGDVGIATDQPTAKLDINGTVRYRGSIYNQLSYQVTGSYSANTWYDFATSATLTQNGIYILTAYIEDFAAGGGNYYTYVASTNFYWVTTGTNRPTAFNFPPMLGTGHATGIIPSIRVTQELGSSGALSRLQWQSAYTYTNLQNAGGRQLRFDLKRIGA